MGAVLEGRREAETEKSDVTLAFGDDRSEINLDQYYEVKSAIEKVS